MSREKRQIDIFLATRFLRMRSQTVTVTLVWCPCNDSCDLFVMSACNLTKSSYFTCTLKIMCGHTASHSVTVHSKSKSGFLNSGNGRVRKQMIFYFLYLATSGFTSATEVPWNRGFGPLFFSNRLLHLPIATRAAHRCRTDGCTARIYGHGCRTISSQNRDLYGRNCTGWSRNRLDEYGWKRPYTVIQPT
jgi:hypothetical protein